MKCWACGSYAPAGVCTRPHPAINYHHAYDHGHVNWRQPLTYPGNSKAYPANTRPGAPQWARSRE